MSGLPYLRNSWIENFINCILLDLVQEYGNSSQKSQKRNWGTFYFQALCDPIMKKLLDVALTYIQILGNF